MIPLLIGVAGGIAAFATFQYIPSDMGGFLSMAALAFIMGDIAYIFALFVTYMVVDPKKWEEG